MLKQQARFITATIFLIDLALIVVAFFAAYWVRSALLPQLAPAVFTTRLYPLQAYLPLLPLALTIWGASLLLTQQYRSHRTVRMADETIAIIRIGATATVLFTLTIYLFRLDELLLGNDLISRFWIFLFAVLSILLLLTEKLGVRVTSRYVRSHGFNYRTVVIVGIGESGLEIANSIRSHRYWGFKVLGMVRSGTEDQPAGTLDYPLIGDLEDLDRIVENNVVDDVIFAVSRRDLDRMEDLFLRLQERGIRTRFALNLFPHTPAKIELESLDEVPLLSFSPAPNSVVAIWGKRLVDIGVSAILLALGLPVILIVALAVRVTSGGAIFFRQTRCGLNGRLFTLYKFRTMVEGAHERRKDLLERNEMTGPAFKLRRDPRVTPLGRWLRRFSLDELPQLWNVLRGEMSMVGPRPPIPEEVAQYKPWQRRRLSMKPGLTCLWQISGRNETSDFDRWMQLDLEYIDSWSPLLDFKILLKTIPVVLSGRGAS